MTPEALAAIRLEDQGLSTTGTVSRNLTEVLLYENAIRNGEGRIAQGGAFVAVTGVHTGRSANDKFLVREPSSEANIWWGAVNKPFAPDKFDLLHEKIQAHLGGKDLYVQDCWAGADSKYRIGVRVVTETAWHNLFARNMFIQPTESELESFDPDFTMLHAPSFHSDSEIDGTRTDVFVIGNFAKRVVIIGGTSYAGEIKKSVFSVLNYLLPEHDVLPMHCSVNVGRDNDPAIFFGLSGTGKTTLSADPKRGLIGDDEHGWSESGLFNFEGGCYAKVIRLSAEAEPEIFATTERFGTVLENVVMDENSGTLDLDDASLTENTRASYPLNFIPNAIAAGTSGHPRNVVMLTADAFGVLPPLSRLTPDQAMYQFLSGYTAKVAGTEKGLGKEPQATFSTCFGAPFMPRHPTVYAELLGRRIRNQDTQCWLVNTGWTGGPYGVGERMSIQHTRALLNAALHGALDSVEFSPDPYFGLEIPASCPGVPADVLSPRNTWTDKAAYDTAAADLVARFHKNFEQFQDQVEESIRLAAPKAA